MSIAFELNVCSSEVDDVVLRIVRMPSIPILVTVSYFADLNDITYKDINLSKLHIIASKNTYRVFLPNRLFTKRYSFLDSEPRSRDSLVTIFLPTAFVPSQKFLPK